MDPNKEPRSETLAAYLEGEVTASESAAIARALGESADLRRRFEQLQQIRETLRASNPELDAIDLVPRIRRAKNAPERHRRRFPFRSWYPIAAAAAGLALIGGGAFWKAGSDAEFTTKGPIPSAFEQDRWAGVQIYRVPGDRRPEPLGARLSNREALLFSYTNLGPQPFGYLMIFGVDAKGEVRWFHPAYETLGSDPTSIAIEKGRANVFLPEQIRQDFAGGPVTIYALFTQRALRVLEVEAWLRAHRGTTSALPTEDASLQALNVWVE
jgi:hypothetical protein